MVAEVPTRPHGIGELKDGASFSYPASRGSLTATAAISASLRSARDWLGLDRDSLTASLSTAWALTIPVVLVALALLPAAWEPEANASFDTRLDWLIGLPLNLLMAAGGAAMIAGALNRRRWSLAGALLASVSFLLLTVSCPLSGHHVFGSRWFGTAACVGVSLAISIAALRSTAPRHSPVPSIG
jgi:peptidoglycan/LPS O-acetylase OafA/YrhL